MFWSGESVLYNLPDPVGKICASRRARQRDTVSLLAGLRNRGQIEGPVLSGVKAIEKIGKIPSVGEHRLAIAEQVGDVLASA